jgi:hypothetical protein
MTAFTIAGIAVISTARRNGSSRSATSPKIGNVVRIAISWMHGHTAITAVAAISRCLRTSQIATNSSK